MICESFAPILAPRSRVLIVGSMPGVRSLEQAQYYAHPRNAFWRILFETFGQELTEDYEEKKRLIMARDLALWDVARACEREGSLDSDMRNIVHNDFGELFAAQPGIHTILCNGATAHALFEKSGVAGARTVIRLPSTSPAYTLSYEKKYAAWSRAIREALARAANG